MPTLLAPAAPALADDVPGVGNWSQYHFSLDPTPMRIVFTHPRAAKGSFPDLVVPRAYVYYAHRRPPSNSGPLLPIVETDAVALLFMDGSGEPYSTALDARARQDRTDRYTAAAKLRTQVYDVQLSPTTNVNQAAETRGQVLRKPVREEAAEGLEQYKNPGSSFSYFPGEDSDAFWTARCVNPISPGSFCTYQVRVTDGVMAEVSFVDFRLHGGRAEANRRLRFAREVVCRYLERC